jgi:hypothetical protein
MKRTSSFLLTLLSLSLFLWACGSDSGDSTSSGQVPVDLQNIEGIAEDAYDMALAGKWDKVAADATDLDAQWAAYRDQALNDGASESLTTSLENAIAGLADAAASSTDKAVVARAANAVSAPMPDLFALYQSTIPTEILALDYLGREIVLDGMDGNLGEATTDTDTTQAIWDAVRAEVYDAGGDQVAADYDASIASIRQTIKDQDAAALIAEANNGLEIVDRIENVF